LQLDEFEIKAASKYELYLMVRRALIYKYFKGRKIGNCDILYQIANERDSRIIKFAIKDAMIPINSARFGMRQLAVVDIKRIDLMTAAEINQLIQKIGASVRQPVVNDDVIEKKTFLDIIGIPSENLVICTVDGVSMEGIIEPGDMLLVDTAEEPVNNKIVVVNIDGNLLVKRFLKQGDEILLLSDNPVFEPIKVRDGDSFEIYGVVKRIMRSI